MKTKYQQNNVSKAIWPWHQEKAPSLEKKPTLLSAIFILLLSWGVGYFLYRSQHTMLALVTFSISILVFISALFLPSLYASIDRFCKKISSIVGMLLTWFFLLPFFYICFPLGRIAQLIKRKDPMQRSFDSKSSTYWQICNESSSVDGYKRQF